MMAFKEIQRLKELLELERSTQEALVVKLQQQNHEVATEVSQLRLKLASLQLVSPLPSQKVYLHTGKCPSLSPIREAESSEAESDGTQGLVPEGIEETQSILRERENHSSDFTTIADRKDKCIFDKSLGKEEKIGNPQMGEFHSFNSEASVSKSRGKENNDPELLAEFTGDPHMTSEEDAGVIRKRPPPRPLPNLLSNILHRCKDVECAPSADYSESSGKCVSKGISLIGSVPILHGKVKAAVPQAPAQAAQATWSCISVGVNSVDEPTVDAVPASQVLHDLSTGLCGDQVGCTFQVPCSQTAMTHFATVQQCQCKTRVELDGHECMIKSDAGGKDVSRCKQLEGGRHDEGSNYLVHTDCKCSAFHQCLPNCVQRLSSNVAKVPCPEQLRGPEKESNETSNHEDLIGPKIGMSQKKLRFDPTAGEEGMFYYEADVEKNVKQDLETKSFQPTVPGERQRVQVGGKTEQVSSSMSSIEGQMPESDPLESHWTPEAIEKRNSFHRIPVVSPRAMNDERQPDEQRRLFSDSMRTKIAENEVEREVSCSEELVQLPASESEVVSLRNERPSSHKLRPSSQRTSTCGNCSSFVPLRSKKVSSKLFAKPVRRCSKCSSIVESAAAIHRYQEKEKCTGRKTRKEKYPECKRSSTEFESVNETCGGGPEEDLSVSDSSTPSRSGNMTKCGKHTTRPRSMLFKAVQQKQRRGQVGTTKCVPAREEESNAASVVFCVASEDLNISTHSNTDYSSNTRRHVPTFPFKVCRIHTRKVKKKRGNKREMKSVKLGSGRCSDSTPEVVDVNRAILDMLRQSDGKHKGQLKAPLADSTECWIETWRFAKPLKSSCNESTDKETSKGSSGSFVLHGKLDADSGRGRGLKLGCEDRQWARQHQQVRERKHRSETWKNFDVDNLLDRFIQSNAEYAAELIKCSVYFESTSSRPPSQSNIVSEEATEDCTLSNLHFQKSITGKRGIGSRTVSCAREQPRRELSRVDHNEVTQPCPVESVRCNKCGSYSKPGTVLLPAGAIETVKTQEDLCDTCSASVTPERKAMRMSAEIGPDRSRQSAPGSVPLPIVLPRLNSDDALQIHEAGWQQKSVYLPGTSEILICDVKKSGDWPSDALHDRPHPSAEEYRMPIITRVSVSSRRSTPSMEMEEDGNAKELTDMFDMSLYDLVNDLEGQRRDYWRKVNSHSKEEGTQIGKQCNNRRQLANAGIVHRSYSTSRLPPSKQVLPSYYR